ncbi:MAG: PEGA domain-containing protein [Brevinemataceae bacterium]
MKYKAILLIFLILNSCSRLPMKEEIEYRNKLEDAIIKTFPKKVTILIHKFDNLSPSDTNRAYLEDALPDSIESMLEPMRSSLAYMGFDGMPFYVSEEISNLFQSTTTNSTNTNTNNIVEETNNTDSTNTNTNKTNDNDGSYFSYLTNYLTIVPIEVTQFEYKLDTNTNYFEVLTNETFVNGESVTNYESNEILITTTNSVTTNLVIENRNILSPTNMLMLIYEEYPSLTNYLSYLPIELRRATDEETKEYKFSLTNKGKKPKQTTSSSNSTTNSITNQESKEISFYPKESFDYTYHISGSFRSFQRGQFQPVEVNVKASISTAASSGLIWWKETYNSAPPKLSDLIKLDKSLDKNNPDEYQKFNFRTPFKKPPVSARLKDEFEMVSTNFRDDKPSNPKDNLPQRTKPINLTVQAFEDKIPFALKDWLKYFHSAIINRPYTVLRVNTNPEGVLIYLNGFFIGTTPLVYPTAPTGEQRITFIKDGFSREEAVIDVIANQTNSISFSLTKQNNSGVISITSSIPNAEVFFNAKYQGIAPVVLSNVELNIKHRLEVLNPNTDISSNRNSVYKEITLTKEKPSINIDAQFKSFETKYKPAAQKGLLAGTYLSWIATFAILGVSVYSQSRANELNGLAGLQGISIQQREIYKQQGIQHSITAQATLYTSLAGLIISSGIMGWYLYSKEIYLGLDFTPSSDEWYANLKLKF